MKPAPTSNALGNEKTFRRLSTLLVLLMMASGIMTFGTFIQNVAPSWHSGIIAAILLFVVLDRLLTYRGLKSLTPLSSEWVIAIGAQWIVIFVLIRLLLSYANGVDAFRADISLFVRGDLTAFFTPEFVMSLLLAVLVWYLSGHFFGLLDEMGLDQELALSAETAHIRSNTVPARQRLVNLVFSTGIALLILTALTRLNFSAIVSNPEGMPRLELNQLSGSEAGALLYFVFGLALLSLGRLLSLQTHWYRQRIPVSSKHLTRQWGVYSVIFLLILAVIVSLLPAGDSMGLFSLLGTLLGFLVSVLFFIGQLLFLLLALLFSLPMLLLRGEPATTAPEPPPFPTMPSVEPASPVAVSEQWMLIRSILLWGTLLAIIVFAFVQFGRQHGSIRAVLSRSRVTNWLVLAWQWIYRNMDKTRGSLSRIIQDGWQSMVLRLEGKRTFPRPRLISLRSMDPRRRIYFFYLAMIRRSTEQGLARKPSQTPSEYAVQLEKDLPSAREDIRSITQAFIEARYSRQEVGPEKAGVVKATWSRIRRALQLKSKSGQAPSD